MPGGGGTSRRVMVESATLRTHTGIMRAPRRRRPLRRSFVNAPRGVDLAVLAQRASYVGSSEHKTYPSFAGQPRLRADASKCDPKRAEQGGTHVVAS